MWACSLQEVQQALDAFPATTEAIAHTVLVCERCSSAIFPRDRDVLTLRTELDPLAAAATGMPLSAANFQLSMPHVDGCCRRQMPLQPVAVQLPKSELKFAVERMEGCPVAPKLSSSPRYRPRRVEIVTQQNHLHQVSIRLLSTVIGTFDPDSAASARSLRQVVAMFGKMEPLALYSEWSPPRQLSEEKLLPKKVTSSSEFDELHAASNVLESGSGFWRSSSKTDENGLRLGEWIVCQFSSMVTLSSVELKWRAGFLPEYFSLSVSKDGVTYDTVVVVVVSKHESRILVPKGTLVTSIKVTMFSPDKGGKSFGLESINCKEASFDSVYTPTSVVLRDIQRWLYEAAASSSFEVRDLAVRALQSILLASGSLCGLLQLATCLLLNTRVEPTTATTSIDRQKWDHLDILSEDGQSSAQLFVQKLAASIQRMVVVGHPQVGSLDRCYVEQLSSLRREMCGAESNTLNEDARYDNCPPASLVTLLVKQQFRLKSIERRSQLGMIVLHMLGELSAWQMKRMQKAEEPTGKWELDPMQLEEPYSVEVCPELFALSHRLLTSVLGRWLSVPQHKQVCAYSKKWAENDEGALTGKNDEDCSSQDLYDALVSSFGHFRAALEKQDDQSGIDSSRGEVNEDCSGHSTYSPGGLCVAVLEIITTNLRRLVVSRIDPIEIGITPSLLQSEDDLSSAPPALNPTMTLLEQLISLGTKRSDAFFPVSLKAAVAMEVGTDAFHPSAHQRTKVLALCMGKGATLEVQVRWPVREREQEDPRYERLMLMLQLECMKLGFRHAIRGRWQFFMHLVIDVPSVQDTDKVLTQYFAPCIQRAGFSSWQVAAGAQELPINLQRHLHWNRFDKMSQDSGAGWIRVYPAGVAAYVEVLAVVDEFLAKHAEQTME
ncbi:unnamed protein product [Hyaloperonospora brassicae]|uniref:F5/8 type C domain-containing protein n=1 Tax=Hyaloperonospora brassicae TaxID=162125 RepID=A0AAV0UNX0_HYABA|nr:unnamed protein product [Hyaloperonospora brassicae]